jgi:hypothetical protein
LWVESPISPTDEFFAVIPTIQRTILDGLGSTTENRQMSSVHLKSRSEIVACTLMDPRMKSLKWTMNENDINVPIKADVIDKAWSWISSKALEIATGNLW